VQSNEYAQIKIGALAAGPIALLLFTVFVSTSTANVICFTAFVTSIWFIVFSVWLLG
jgi:H+-translocating diphosphatase